MKGRGIPAMDRGRPCKGRDGTVRPVTGRGQLPAVATRQTPGCWLWMHPAAEAVQRSCTSRHDRGLGWGVGSGLGRQRDR